MPTLKIHSENILPIIKKWLYSDKDIFLRELISNACDAISKLKILRDRGEIEMNDEELRIDIEIDKEQRQIKITDTGIGMTADEVERYIAQLAFSGAEEFLNKYKSQNEHDQVIGHFGLGFYSSFMVSSKVQINTLSYQKEALPAFWSCDGSSSYTLEKGTSKTRGTEIILHINKDDEEYLDDHKIKEILHKYCQFLPCPIYVGKTCINETLPLWIKSPQECSDKDYLKFYHALYPFEPDPIFWIHLSIDYPFHLKGILYFPKITKRFDFSKSAIQLYCNRVFVSDHCKDLIPDFLTILRGAIDCPDIPLNVSRSYLQMDRTVRQLANHISKKISDRLSQLFNTDREKYVSLWPDMEIILKLGIMQDEKFYERMKDLIIWKNASGLWTTLSEYLDRNKDQKKVFYSKNHDSPFLKMYQEKGIEVLFIDSYIDTSLLSFLETKLESISFQRIDGAIDDLILDKAKEKTILDADGKTEAAKIADFFRKQLDIEGLEIEAKSLASSSVPAFVVIDEKNRRMREFLSLSSEEISPSMRDKQTFVINTNSSLIQCLIKLGQKDFDLVKEAINQLYELSLLSQGELSPEKFPRFISRSSHVLEKLAKAVTS